MEVLERNKCIVTGNTDLKNVYTFKKFPVYCGCVDTSVGNDLFCDMSWDICESSGNIQLKYLIPLDILYSKNHNPGSVGKTWKEHHENFSNFIKESEYENVLEIGGSTGNLFDNFISEDKDFTWTVLEPSGVFKFEDPRVKSIQDFFEDHDFGDEKYDVIVHSHVLEHVYNPIEFVSKASELMDVGGVQYISIPNMRHWLEMGYTNTLFFEHTYYIDIDILEYILTKNNFVIDKIIAGNHSIFVKSVKVDNTTTSNAYFEKPKQIFCKYIEGLEEDILSINSKLSDDDNVFLFGAHIFSQTLLSLGIKSKVLSILDNDKKKQDKRLYGTDLIVKDPKVLYNYTEPKVIIRAGVYSEEIKAQLLSINPTTKFL